MKIKIPRFAKIATSIFILTFVVYYLLTTRGQFRIPGDVDYFSPLAKSFISGRLDIPSPVFKNDLTFFEGKWYLYWGPLPAILLIPGQLILGRYYPPVYLSMLIVSSVAVGIYFLFLKLKKIYLDDNFSNANIFLFVAYFLLGTSLMYSGTRSGVWYVAQTFSLLPQLIGLYFLIGKKLRVIDYFWGSFFISLSLLGRYNLILGMLFLILRLLDDKIFNKISNEKWIKNITAAALPFCLFFLIFSIYNIVRFHSPLDFGFSYTTFDYFDFAKAAPFGIYSQNYILKNLWLIFLEIPKLSLKGNNIKFDFNYAGISIFFTSPLLLASLLTFDRQLLKLRDFSSRIKIYLWIWVISQVALLLPFYTLSLVQFGVRYSLDFALPLLVLSVFGLRGKINPLVILAAIFAFIINLYSVFFKY